MKKSLFFSLGSLLLLVGCSDNQTEIKVVANPHNIHDIYNYQVSLYQKYEGYLDGETSYGALPTFEDKSQIKPFLFHENGSLDIFNSSCSNNEDLVGPSVLNTKTIDKTHTYADTLYGPTLYWDEDEYCLSVTSLNPELDSMSVDEKASFLKSLIHTNNDKIDNLFPLSLTEKHVDIVWDYFKNDVSKLDNVHLSSVLQDDKTKKESFFFDVLSNNIQYSIKIMSSDERNLTDSDFYSFIPLNSSSLTNVFIGDFLVSDSKTSALYFEYEGYSYHIEIDGDLDSNKDTLWAVFDFVK